MKKEIPMWEQKNKVCLNLGCGVEVKKGFINVDKFYTYEQLTSKQGIFKQAKIDKGAKYVQADILKLPFEDNSVDYIELMNVIEHLPMKQMVSHIKEIRRVMKPKAQLIILTNNMNGLAIDWLDMVNHPPFDLQQFINVAETIYGNQFAEGETHRCPFNQEFMNFVLTQSGFTEGKVVLLRKGDLCPVLGSAKPFRKDAVLRNDLVYAEAIK